MKQRGGGVVTCAGNTVTLIPATDYAGARMLNIYGSTQGGVNSNPKPPRFSPDSPEYRSMVKTTRCDAQGNFNFDRVADGDFYVQTFVAWEVAGRAQGGNLMQRASVRGGQIVSVVLAA